MVALLVTIEAPQLSALWARFPLPVIPAPGDPTPSAPSSRVLADLPRRVRISDAHQTGFIAGAVLLSVIGSLAIAWRPETLSRWGWYVVAATWAAAALRARVWDSAASKAWLLAQPYLVAGGLVVLYTSTAQYLAALIAVVVLAALVLGVGRGRAEPVDRFAGHLLAAVASAGGIRCVGHRRVADPGDRVPGRDVRLGAQSMSSARTRRSGCLAATLVAALWTCAPAQAISRPQVDPGAAPPNGAPGPVAADGEVRRVQCHRCRRGNRLQRADAEPAVAGSVCGMAVFPRRRTTGRCSGHRGAAGTAATRCATRR